jgi:hypothetical protein
VLACAQTAVVWVVGYRATLLPVRLSSWRDEGGIGMDARELRSIRRVKFLGCGSAYYAG